MPIILNNDNELLWLNGKDYNLFKKPEINLRAIKV